MIVFANVIFFTYATNELGYDKIEITARKEVCDRASAKLSQSDYIKMGEALIILQWIYKPMNGDDWYHKEGWVETVAKYGLSQWWNYVVDDIGDAYCDWYGVTCNERKILTGIDLSNNDLTGTVNWSRTFRCPELVRIDLSQNQISGKYIVQELS